MGKHIFSGTIHGQIYSVLMKILLQTRGLWKKIKFKKRLENTGSVKI